MPKLTKQQKKVSENVKHRNRSVLVAPTDFGKTRVYINGVSGYKKIIILVNTYNSVSGIERDLRLFRPKAIIVVPQGQERIRRHYCNNDKCDGCGAIKKPKRNPKKKQLKGKIIDPEFVIRHNPNYCPYHFLIKLANEMADVVVTHHSMLTENNRLKREGALVCDEVDEALKPTSILLSKYEIGKNKHLETSREKSDLEWIISIVRELLKKNPHSDPIDKKDFEDKFNYFLERLKEIHTEIAKPPNIIEAQRLREDYYDHVPYEGYLMTAKSKQEEIVNQSFNGHLKQNLQLLAKEMTGEISTQIPPIISEDLKRLSWNKKYSLLDFLNSMKNITEVKTRTVPKGNEEKGYQETRAVFDQNELLEASKEFDKSVMVTATSPTLTPEGHSVVRVEEDPNADKKLVVHCKRKVLQDALPQLKKKYNLLGITTNKGDRLKKAKRLFGGEELDINELDKVNKRKGLLLWDYYGSETSRAVNELGCLDGCIVHEWISRDPGVKEGTPEHRREMGKQLYQFVSRVFRTHNGYHRASFAIVNDEDAYEELQSLTDWKFKKVKDKDELLKALGKHTEPLPLDKSSSVEYTISRNNSTGQLYIVIPPNSELAKKLKGRAKLSEDELKLNI